MGDRLSNTRLQLSKFLESLGLRRGPSWRSQRHTAAPGPRSRDADAGSADLPDTRLARLCGVLSTGVDKSDMKRPGADTFWLQSPRLAITRLTPLLAPAPGCTRVMSPRGLVCARSEPGAPAEPHATAPRPGPALRLTRKPGNSWVLICRQPQTPLGAEANGEPGSVRGGGRSGVVSAALANDFSAKT